MDADPLFPFLAIARWVHFAAVFSLFGAPLFFFYAVRGGMRGALECLPRTAARTDRYLRVAAVAACISGVFWLAASMVAVAGDLTSTLDSEFLVNFFSSPFGTAELVRVGLFAFT